MKNKSKVLHSNISIVFIFPYSLSVPEHMTWSLRLDLVNVQFYKPDVPANRLFMGIKELLLSTGTGKLESVTNSALIYKTPNFPCLYLHFWAKLDWYFWKMTTALLLRNIIFLRGIVNLCRILLRFKPLGRVNNNNVSSHVDSFYLFFESLECFGIKTRKIK